MKEESATMATLLWLQGGACSGNTMSFFNAEEPSICDLVTDFGIEILWHPSLGMALGDALKALLADIIAGRQPLDLLVFEGTVILAACRREHPSPWQARSVGRHSSTLVRFRIDTPRCSDRRYVGFGRERSQRTVQLLPAYLIADETGTLSPGAEYATASD